MASNEEGCDREQVVSEVALSFGSLIATVNHEPSASFLEDELQEVVAESCKPVAVQDHNLRDHAGECSFQKGTQPFPLEVDPGADVFDEDVSRVRLLEVLGLAVEVGTLLGTTDAGVDVPSLGCVGCGDPEESCDTVCVVEAFTSWGADVFEVSGGRPAAKCGCRDSILGPEVSCWFISDLR